MRLGYAYNFGIPLTLMDNEKEMEGQGRSFRAQTKDLKFHTGLPSPVDQYGKNSEPLYRNVPKE